MTTASVIDFQSARLSRRVAEGAEVTSLDFEATPDNFVSIAKLRDLLHTWEISVAVVSKAASQDSAALMQAVRSLEPAAVQDLLGSAEGAREVFQRVADLMAEAQQRLAVAITAVLREDRSL